MTRVLDNVFQKMKWDVSAAVLCNPAVFLTMNKGQ
jgi:hypothetical protein